MENASLWSYNCTNYNSNIQSISTAFNESFILSNQISNHLYPTTYPTNNPTAHPSQLQAPTYVPTSNPTINPTIYPTQPSYHPTIDPTSNPTYFPTYSPTDEPTLSVEEILTSQIGNAALLIMLFAICVVFVTVMPVFVYHTYFLGQSRGKNVQYSPIITFVHSTTDFITDIIFSFVLY